MGIAILGGLGLGTGLTLFAVPAVYTYLTRKTLTAAAREAAGAEPEAVGEAA
jgi:multidrug efflux pump